MTHGEKVGTLFLEGYNCAQSVVLAFADEMGIPKETAARIASSFGGGLGRLREVCGCVSGMAIVAGELLGYSGPETGKPKADHYALIQELAEEFRKKNGSIICRDLLSGITSDTAPVPEARTDDYYKKRPCKIKKAAVMTSLPVCGERPHGRRFLYGLSREWLNGTSYITPAGR